MEAGNVTAYRAQAEKCSRQSDLACDTDSRLHLLDLADAWLKLADNLVAKETNWQKDADGHVKSLAGRKA